MKKVLILTLMALLMPFSFSSCSDPEAEDELVGGYYCYETDTYIMLKANGRGFIEDVYSRDNFRWWADRYTITFSFDGGSIETYNYRFTHDGLYINDDYYVYADYGVYAKKKAAKKQEQKVEEKKEVDK